MLISNFKSRQVWIATFVIIFLMSCFFGAYAQIISPKSPKGIYLNAINGSATTVLFQYNKPTNGIIINDSPAIYLSKDSFYYKLFTDPTVGKNIDGLELIVDWTSVQPSSSATASFSFFENSLKALKEINKARWAMTPRLGPMHVILGINFVSAPGNPSYPRDTTEVHTLFFPPWLVKNFIKKTDPLFASAVTNSEGAYDGKIPTIDIISNDYGMSNGCHDVTLPAPWDSDFKNAVKNLVTKFGAWMQALPAQDRSLISAIEPIIIPSYGAGNLFANESESGSCTYKNDVTKVQVTHAYTSDYEKWKTLEYKPSRAARYFQVIVNQYNESFPKDISFMLTMGLNALVPINEDGAIESSSKTLRSGINLTLAASKVFGRNRLIVIDGGLTAYGANTVNLSYSELKDARVSFKPGWPVRQQLEGICQTVSGRLFGEKPADAAADDKYPPGYEGCEGPTAMKALLRAFEISRAKDFILLNSTDLRVGSSVSNEATASVHYKLSQDQIDDYVQAISDTRKFLRRRISAPLPEAISFQKQKFKNDTVWTKDGLNLAHTPVDVEDVFLQKDSKRFEYLKEDLSNSEHKVSASFEVFGNKGKGKAFTLWAKLADPNKNRFLKVTLEDEVKQNGKIKTTTLASDTFNLTPTPA